MSYLSTPISPPVLPPVIWLFGLPSAGKTTLAGLVAAKLRLGNLPVVILDGDQLRKGLSCDLGFSDEDRFENIRRAAETSKLLRQQGIAVVCALITQKEEHRALVRRILEAEVKLVHVECPLTVCVERDVKGLYGKANEARISNMTGLHQAFDEPQDIDAKVRSDLSDPAACVESLFASLSLKVG